MTSADVLEADVREEPAFRMDLSLSGEAFQKLVDYHVLVERWPRLWKRVSVADGYGGCATRQELCGKLGREFEQAFTDEEQCLLGQWYKKFHRWYIQEGRPNRVAVASVRELILLHRAVEFFATH